MIKIGEMFDTRAVAVFTDAEWEEILGEFTHTHSITSLVLGDEMLMEVGDRDRASE